MGGGSAGVFGVAPGILFFIYSKGGIYIYELSLFGCPKVVYMTDCSA